MPQTSAIAHPRAIMRRVLPTPSYHVLHRFSLRHTGAYPYAAVINVNGRLYGTASEGGKYRGGTFYSISTSGLVKVLHSFGQGSDVKGPGRLIDVNGTLYGTAGGGVDCKGTVYRISTTGTDKVLYCFKGGSDGSDPAGSLVNVKGTLYGATMYGGMGCSGIGCGTVYSVSTTGAEKVLYRFKGGSQGAYFPGSDLIDVNGTLYGTTYQGGNTLCYYHNGCGTVFGVTTTGVETLLYRFKGGSDGAYPEAGLVNVNGTLYGTTSQDGDRGGGTFYSITTEGVEKALYPFGSRRHDGYLPSADLINVNGTLYGTTLWGGSFQDGTVYRISTTGSENVLYSFAGGSDGVDPSAALLNVKGMLYSTTLYGGVYSGCHNGCGTVFALTP
jgi:uncharacterized repeat protein (TIGR03803 family)